MGSRDLLDWNIRSCRPSTGMGHRVNNSKGNAQTSRPFHAPAELVKRELWIDIFRQKFWNTNIKGEIYKYLGQKRAYFPQRRKIQAALSPPSIQSPEQRSHGDTLCHMEGSLEARARCPSRRWPLKSYVSLLEPGQTSELRSWQNLAVAQQEPPEPVAKELSLNNCYKSVYRCKNSFGKQAYMYI